MRSAGASPRERRRRSAAWLALFLIALGLRAGFAAVRPPPMDGDQQIYLNLAESIAAGRGYVSDDSPRTDVHPLLPTIHAVALLLYPRPRLAGIAVTILIGALLPLVAGRVVASIYGAAAGWAAAGLLAIHPHYILRSARLEPDLLAALIGFCLAGLLWRRRWGVSGAALGLAYLNRPEMFLLAPVAIGTARWRGAGGPALLRMTGLFLAFASVFLLFVHAETGRWALSGKDRWQYMLGVHQWRTHNEPLQPERIPELLSEIPSPSRHIAEQPREFVLGYAYRLGLFLRHLLRQLGLVLAPLALLGGWVAWKRSPIDLLLIAMPCCLAAVYPIVGVFFRHSLVVGPVLVAMAGIGIGWLFGLTSGHRPGRDRDEPGDRPA